MNFFVATSLSPVLAIVLAVTVVAIAKLLRARTAAVRILVELSVWYAIVGAGLSLILLIIWMVWYERISGYSAGNAPLGWIFVGGPVSAAFGQIVALIVWWFKKPKASSHDICA